MHPKIRRNAFAGLLFAVEIAVALSTSVLLTDIQWVTSKSEGNVESINVVADCFSQLNGLLVFSDYVFYAWNFTIY
jgi:hypothetical protein